MNINQLVNDKKDKLATSGRPLNAGAGPDLIEVLATRKLLEEKEAAARELALKQQQTAGTIAEQQEQKLLGLTQKEIANQTGGILAQRAQQPQQQRPPQQGGIMGGARPPMGGAPRPPMGGAPKPPMGGVPSAMGGAPRPRMASGGIVGYNQGGDVNAAVAAAQRQIQALGGTADKSSPEYQAGLKRIMQTLTAQSTPQEKAAVQKVLVDAGLKTGAAKRPDTSAAGFYGDLFDFSTPNKPKNEDREKLKQHKNYYRGSQFGGGIGSPAHGDSVREQIDERGAMAIVDQMAMMSGAAGLRSIIAGAGKKYGPQAVNYAKKKLASMGEKGKNFVRTPARKPRYGVKDGKPVQTAAGAPAKLNVGRTTGGIAAMGYGADALFGGDADAAAQADQDRQVSGIRNDISAAKEMLNTKTGTESKTGTETETGPETVVKPKVGTEGGPAIGKPMEFDFTPKDVGKNRVSSALGTGFMDKLDNRIKQDPAKERDAINLAGRFETDQRVGGLDELYKKRRQEQERLANDPQAQYRRNKARIYSTLGPKGQAYQQGVMDKQGKDMRLINQEIGDYVSLTNTEINLMKDVNARAAEAYKVGMEDIAKAMEVRSGIATSDLTIYEAEAKRKQDKLIKEADARLRDRMNMNYAEANKLARETKDTAAIESLIKSLSEIMRLEMESAAETALDLDQRQAAMDAKSVEHGVTYQPLLLAAIQRLRELNNIPQKLKEGPDDPAGFTDKENDTLSKIENM